LARFSSAFSRFSLLSPADSSVDTPGRAPASISAWRTHLRTVSVVAAPIDNKTAHRCPLSLMLFADLGDNPHRPLPQLRRVPPRRIR